MNKLLKDAIADAKAVRETALANAKATLEEAFAPKLQSMLSHKIKEELDDEMLAEEDDDEVVKRVPPTEQDLAEKAKMKSYAGISEKEAAAEDPAPSEDEDSTEDDASKEASSADSTSDDITSDDLKDGDDLEDDQVDSEEMCDDDLAELLRELEGEEADEDTADSDMPMEEEKEASDKEESDEEQSDEEEVDLDEIIKALSEEDQPKQDEEDNTTKAELEEAYGVIKHLRSQLNELNLLNAKLLFVNKLFRKSELTEAQKVKVVETFDRAKSVREAKLIYTTLVESIRTKPAVKSTTKKKMTEGLASAPQKKTEIIVGSNDQFDRFRDLVKFNR